MQLLKLYVMNTVDCAVETEKAVQRWTLHPRLIRRLPHTRCRIARYEVINRYSTVDSTVSQLFFSSVDCIDRIQNCRRPVEVTSNYLLHLK